MVRPIRIAYPGAAYHVMSRGNFGNKIYKDKTDYKNFLDLLADVLERYNVFCYSYCLMPNHYHLFLETPDPNLSLAMRHLNGRYTQKFNIRYKQYGHLFQGRFKSILVEKELYKFDLIRYIALNPVRAKLAKDPSDWRWSSHNEIIAKERPSRCIDLNRVLGFYDEDKQLARKNYLDNLSLKLDKEFDKNIEKKSIIGGDGFVEKVRKYFEEQSKEKEITKLERYACRPSLEKIFKSKSIDKKLRDRLLKKAFFEYGYTLSEISRETGLHYSTISRLVNDK